MVVTNPLGIDLDQYKYGFHDPEQYTFKSRNSVELNRLNRLIQLEMEGAVG